MACACIHVRASVRGVYLVWLSDCVLVGGLAVARCQCTLACLVRPCVSASMRVRMVALFLDQSPDSVLSRGVCARPCMAWSFGLLECGSLGLLGGSGHCVCRSHCCAQYPFGN